MKKKICILYSGGMDSAILRRLAQCKGHEVSCIYFNHGHDAAKTEMTKLPVDCRVVDFPLIGLSKPCLYGGNKDYLPGRNMVFATLAAAIERPDEIWIGALSNEDNIQGVDKNSAFCALSTGYFSHVLGPFVTNGIKVRAPFVEKSFDKIGAILWALGNAVTLEELMSTHSCYREKECGECGQCLKKYLIFTYIGVQPGLIHPQPDAAFIRRFVIAYRAANPLERWLGDNRKFLQWVEERFG